MCTHSHLTKTNVHKILDFYKGLKLSFCMHFLIHIYIGSLEPKFYEYRYHTFTDTSSQVRTTMDIFKPCTSHNCMCNVFLIKENNLQYIFYFFISTKRTCLPTRINAKINKTKQTL